MIPEDIITQIRDFLRANTQLQSLVGQRVYITRPKDPEGNFILLRNITNGGIDDIIDGRFTLEVKIIAKDKNTSHNDLLPVSKKIFELMHGYGLTLGGFTPYKGFRINGPFQDDEGEGINSLISDYKFYLVT